MSTTRTKANRSGVRFLKYMEQQINQMRLSRKFGTARNYARAQNSLRAFLNGRDLPINCINENLIQEYSNWLERRGVVRNTVSFYMRILRAVYNKAVKDRMARQSYPFRNVYTGIDKTRKKALDEYSVRKLLELDLEHFPALQLSRDIFIFSYCMRGMSFVDIALLRKKDFDGKYISYRRQKTGQRLTIRLEPCAENIIRRYEEETQGSPYIFPIITSEAPGEIYRQYQTALGYHNRKLKKLARMARMNIPLSSYCARHTWATVARNHNIPVSVIAAAMGHTSEKTTLIYLDSLDNSMIDKANRLVLKSLRSPVSL